MKLNFSGQNNRLINRSCAWSTVTMWSGSASDSGASIYPAVQNIIPACRAFGLGTLITTNHIRCEDEVKALLGLPPDVATYALMPIGYPHGKFGPLARRPVGEVAYAERETPLGRVD
jgi:nitroreductase